MARVKRGNIARKRRNKILNLAKGFRGGNKNLFRTALAAGVDAIFLAGGAHPLGQKVLRASSGAVFHLPYLRFDGNEEEILDSLLKSLSELSNEGFRIFSTRSHNESSKKPSKP